MFFCFFDVQLTRSTQNVLASRTRPAVSHLVIPGLCVPMGTTLKVLVSVHTFYVLKRLNLIRTLLTL